jgi:hypothetical protein
MTASLRVHRRGCRSFAWLLPGLNDDFRDRYARAREEQADKLFREIIEIADDASGDYVAPERIMRPA